MSHPLFTNRLIHEKSPYLLQHAHNPVDWYPWGEEAFRAAKEQDKPIFLSIGYSTCHWCHIMEEETFENIEIAQLMNEVFLNIKVDREELPEVDSLYMEFAQAMMSGGAGWPLNVLITPELKPFFACTYLPPDSRLGFLGMKQLILRIKEIWQDTEERENLITQAGKIVDIFAENVHVIGSELPSKKEIQEAAELLFKTADPIYGGTKGAPKFPIGYQACFLLRFARATSDSRALFYVERTLEMMHRGGIYDHLGGGFSRYSIDEKWLVPHFEKMLYDNAILARAYLETWQFTKLPFYKNVCEEILSYVLSELSHPEGGFFSAQDADSQKEEGRFYTWTWEEIQNALGSDAHLFCEFYGILKKGNFEGRNVIHTPHSIEEFAQRHHLDPHQLSQKLKQTRQELNQVRQTRPFPLKDDKVIAAWNGLMIYVLAEAGMAFLNDKYLAAAERAALFIKEKLWKEGTLYRRYRDGETRFEACLDDYAFVIHGLLSLFEADRGSEWLEFALNLTSVLENEFKAEKGAFFLTNGRDPYLLLRRTEYYDGAEPSGNAIHAENLIRLSQITGSHKYLKQAEDILRAAKQHIDLYPPGACYHLIALMRYLDLEAYTFLISLNKKEDFHEEIIKSLSKTFSPFKSLIWKRETDEMLRDLAPWTYDKIPQKELTTLYLCRRSHCEAPINDYSEIQNILEKLS